MENERGVARLRKPEWLKVNLGGGASYGDVSRLLGNEGLHTICSSGRCPNQGECWREGTATFMILGDICTRQCRFCATTTGRPLPPDTGEAERVARSARAMGLRHAVVTSVDRDDLVDGGAAQWRALIRAMRRECPATTLEVLLPDFMGKPLSLEMVLGERPEIAAHNIETVERLTPTVRSRARYNYSLKVLSRIAASDAVCKSGLMLGLGERQEEVLMTLVHLRAAGVEVLTIGQYLQPTRRHHPVERYVPPEEFDTLRGLAEQMGFRYVEAGPLVRSSFHAARALEACGVSPRRGRLRRGTSQWAG